MVKIFGAVKRPTIHTLERAPATAVKAFLPGLGLQYSAMGVEIPADHEEDHGHCNDTHHCLVYR
ncbi:hypothetical protein EYF80_054805 [Liparis tanakae]|uniref:Uncharacterized protein n=1 Tax=Liparis tanakae TaxID=230148 RepID=A0A4Z2F2C1_9TELE|nr:hypothetical protein EYF80_054805 [Liparis tanakae]